MAINTDISSSTDLWGKSVTDLQSDIAFDFTRNPAYVRGTSKYVEDYTSGGFDMSLGHNFLAFKSVAVEGATIKVKVIGGVGDEVTLDNDGIIVLQLVDTATAVRVTATKDGVTETKTISLTLLDKADE